MSVDNRFVFSDVGSADEEEEKEKKKEDEKRAESDKGDSASSSSSESSSEEEEKEDLPPAKRAKAKAPMAAAAAAAPKQVHLPAPVPITFHNAMKSAHDNIHAILGNAALDYQAVNDLMTKSCYQKEVVFNVLIQRIKQNLSFSDALVKILSLGNYRKIFPIDYRRKVVAALLQTDAGIAWFKRDLPKKVSKIPSLVVDINNGKEGMLFDEFVFKCIGDSNLRQLHEIVEILCLDMNIVHAAIKRDPERGINLLLYNCTAETARIVIETWSSNGWTPNLQLSAWKLDRLVLDEDFIMWIRKQMMSPGIAKEMLRVTKVYPVSQINEYVSLLMALKPIESIEPAQVLTTTNKKIIVAAAILSPELLEHTLKNSLIGTVYTEVLAYALQFIKSKSSPGAPSPSDKDEIKSKKLAYEESYSALLKAYGVSAEDYKLRVDKVVSTIKCLLFPKQNALLPHLVTPNCITTVREIMCIRLALSKESRPLAPGAPKILPTELWNELISSYCTMNRRFDVMSRESSVREETRKSLTTELSQLMSRLAYTKTELCGAKASLKRNDDQLKLIAPGVSSIDPTHSMDVVLEEIKLSASYYTNMFRKAMDHHQVYIRWLIARAECDNVMDTIPLNQTLLSEKEQVQEIASKELFAVSGINVNAVAIPHESMKAVADALSFTIRSLTEIHDLHVKIRTYTTTVATTQAKLDALNKKK